MEAAKPFDPAQKAPHDAVPLSPGARIAWAVLIVATLYFCYFSHLGAVGFVGPDEPRYAWIARDMAETGDYITPRLYGRPWFEKPPLYYWSAAISFKIFGVSETAARLPSAIAALLATLALAWLALRLYGAETARWFLLLLPTSIGMIDFSHAASTDMLFSAALTLALVAAVVLLRLMPRNSLVVAQHAAPDPGNDSQVEAVIPSEEPPSLAARSRGTLATSFPANQQLNLAAPVAALLFGLFLGLAVLAKGPAALVLLGGAILFWAVFTKRWRDTFRPFHPLAIAAFCLTALPWYILCARRNPDFFRIFIIEHNFKRYLTPEFQHIQPFWYYAAVLLIALLPWTALLLWSAITGAIRLWRTRNISDATLLLLCWAAFCLLFFSISKSKLPGYILPAIPVVALLVSHSRFALATHATKALVLVNLVAALILSTCFAVTESVAPHVSQGNINFGLAAGLACGVLSVANLLLGVGLRPWSKGRPAVAACCVLPVLLAGAVSDKSLGSLFYWDPSGKTIGKELQRLQIPREALGVRTMSRGQRYSLDFYLGWEVPEWDREHLRDGYVLSGTRFCRGTIGEDFTCEEVPFDLQKTGFFLFRVRPRSVSCAPDGGKAK